MIVHIVTGTDARKSIPWAFTALFLPLSLQTALQKGLVDQIGTFENAVDEAKKLAGWCA